MNGILNVLKPAGMTSFDVVGFLKRQSGQKKIGHTGTLDPSAVGVLPICLGNATKAIEYMIDKDKVYRAELTLGVATDTQDSSGKVIFSGDVVEDHEAIKAAIMTFVGDIDQVPPMYSAIKIGGKKLYEIARSGGTVERQARKITIYSIDVLSINKENFTVEKDTENHVSQEYLGMKVLFDVHCSKGTYIRTLCHDIGEKLGCGGHMSFLVRTRAGKYSIDSAVTIEQIKEMAGNNTLADALVSAETVFEAYSSVHLTKANTFKYSNGGWLEIQKESAKIGDVVKVYDENCTFLGLGEYFVNDGALFLKSRKFFNRD